MALPPLTTGILAPSQILDPACMARFLELFPNENRKVVEVSATNSQSLRDVVREHVRVATNYALAYLQEKDAFFLASRNAVLNVNFPQRDYAAAGFSLAHSLIFFVENVSTSQAGLFLYGNLLKEKGIGQLLIRGVEDYWKRNNISKTLSTKRSGRKLPTLLQAPVSTPDASPISIHQLLNDRAIYWVNREQKGRPLSKLFAVVDKWEDALKGFGQVPQEKDQLFLAHVMTKKGANILTFGTPLWVENALLNRKSQTDFHPSFSIFYQRSSQGLTILRTHVSHDTLLSGIELYITRSLQSFSERSVVDISSEEIDLMKISGNTKPPIPSRP